MESRNPKIRFKGFNKEWEEVKLGNIAEFFNGRRIPIESEIRVKGQYPYYGASGIIDYVEGYIFDGEYVLLAEDGANIIMRNSPIAYLTKGKFWVNNHAHIMRMKKGSNIFLAQILENKSYDKFNSGTAQPKLNSQVVKNITFNVPPEDEQIKIGEFFKQLDSSISLHQQELDTLKQTKQGFLQKMFPKEGESVPEVRFPGFSDKWKICKLGDIVDITMGQSPDGKNYTKNSNDHILVQGNADIKNGWVSPRVWTTQVTKTASKDDIILGVRAPVGDVGKTQYDVVLGRGVAGIKGNEFIFQLLSKMKTNGYWTKYSTGSTFESINSTDLKEAMINIPSEVEQTEIGNFFEQLDKVIALHQQELDALKQTKKAFLQKMFV